jgi:hypothetical protein
MDVPDVNFDDMVYNHMTNAIPVMNFFDFLDRACPQQSGRSPLLPAERASLGQAGLSTSRLAENGGAGAADDNGLGVREDGGDVEATGALDVHEERAGAGHKGLKVAGQKLFIESGLQVEGCDEP